jgi:hypothetical protein
LHLADSSQSGLCFRVSRATREVRLTLMDIGPGGIYRRSPERGSEWFLAALQEAYRTGTHPITISIMTTGGSVLSGQLEGVGENAVNVREPGEPDVAEIESDDIEAFTLLAEPPPDRNDELPP